MVDLRSDTITRPTPEMRRAMAEAEVGDDVYDDDPTVNRLQEVSATLLGKEAALFVPSGTMSNSIAIKTHTKSGDEILLDGEAHSMLYEAGLPAVVAAVLTRQFRANKGIPDPQDIRSQIHVESLHNPGTALLVLENTHNRSGGVVIPLGVHKELWDIAQEHGLKVHIDGARLFNAVVASGISVREYAACADTVTFCLSKGLGCPVGSVLCMLGGGMRQAGILAAAGLYALEHNIERLADDHANAKRLAAGIADAHGVHIVDNAPPTNMIYFDTTALGSLFVAEMAKRGVIASTTAPRRIRLVTHLDVDAEDIEKTISVVQEVGVLLTQ
ncbi:MAG: aminotransferase class I/II-fold pyridoxal phosphate-dependent enzyme [Armatimonadetes bacterium]|nr:aminotransferase class I/II-fold pyridoxal phosphate-dependent enzyme [Armatimonadota bacterium]